MTDAFEDHSGTVIIGGCNITNYRFTDDIVGQTGSEGELTRLVNSLNKTCIKYGMEISTENTKIMTNNYTIINLSGQMLEIVSHFKTCKPSSMKIIINSKSSQKLHYK